MKQRHQRFWYLSRLWGVMVIVGSLVTPLLAAAENSPPGPGPRDTPQAKAQSHAKAKKKAKSKTSGPSRSAKGKAACSSALLPPTPEQIANWEESNRIWRQHLLMRRHLQLEEQWKLMVAYLPYFANILRHAPRTALDMLIATFTRLYWSNADRQKVDDFLAATIKQLLQNLREQIWLGHHDVFLLLEEIPQKDSISYASTQNHLLLQLLRIEIFERRDHLHSDLRGVFIREVLSFVRFWKSLHQDINDDTKLVISKFVANLLPPMTLVLPAEHQPLIDVFQKWFPTRKSRNSPLAQTIAQNFQRVVSSELCGRSCFVFNLANPSADDSFHEEGQDFLTYLDQLQGAERLEHQNETEQEQREKLFAANIPRNTSRFILGGDAYYKVINRLVYPQMFFASPLLQNEHLPLLVSDKRFAQSLDQAIAVVARQKIWRTSYEERDVNINILPFINVFHRVGKFFQEHQQPLPDFYQASVRRMLHFVERELDKYYQRLKVAEFSPASSSPPPPPETVQMVTDYLDILNDLARSMVQAQDGESLFVYYNVLSRWQHYAPAGKALIYLYQTLYPLIKDNPSFQVKHFYTEIFQASYDALPALEIDGRPDIDLRPFRMGEFLNAYPGQNFDPEIKEIYAQLMGVDLADLANENACLDRIDRYVHRVRWGLMSDFLRLDLQNNNGQGLEAIAGLVLRFYPPWTRHTTIFYEQFLSFINEIALFRHNLFILAPYAGDGNVGYFRALLADHAYRPEFLRAIWAYWKKIYHPSPEDQAALGAAAAQDGSTKVRRPLSFGQTQLLDVAERALYAIFLPETKNKFGEPLPLPIYRLTFAAYADLWREYLAFLEQEVFPFYNVDPHSPWARLVTIIGQSFAPTTSAKMNPARTEEFEEFPFDREALIGRLQEFVRSFPRNNYPVTELDPKAILAQPYLAFELVWRTQLTNPNAANLFPSFIILRLLDMSVTAYQDYLRGMGNEVAYGRIQDLEELLVQRPNAQHSLLEPAEVVALLRGITSQTYFEPSDQATEPREFVMRAKRLLFEMVRPYSTKIFMADEKNLNINIPSTIHQDELARHLDALQFRQFCNIIDPP